MPPQKNLIYDLIVIGAGPGGIHAALEAGSGGLRVLLIEAHPEHIGGAWLHTGTLPSKSLREFGALFNDLQNLAGPQTKSLLAGLFSAEALYDQQKQVAQAQESFAFEALRQAGVTIERGYGRLAGQGIVGLAKTPDGPILELFHSEKLLLSTGSKPRRPQEIPFDAQSIVDADEILQLKTLPQSLAIYGAGVVGCEYAALFAALGVKVDLFDARARALAGFDEELSGALIDSFRALGIGLHFKSKLLTATPSPQGVNCQFDTGPLTSEVLFYAAGRIPALEGLGLEAHGLKLSARGDLKVNEDYQTEVPWIYAVGDCIGPPGLAATARMQGISLGRLFSQKPRLKTDPLVPLGVYTIPELAQVGLCAAEAQAKGIEYYVGRAHYCDTARGHMRSELFGFLKLVVEKGSGILIGAQIIGHDACNLIHLAQAYIRQGVKAAELCEELVYNYPTLAELYRLAAEDALRQGLYVTQNSQPTPMGSQS